ncbi:MAG: hemerythrin family protein [Oscillospiraceae bacterium]|nr:hemerythrin family protein [Oscillospiraceae bacterium]
MAFVWTKDLETGHLLIDNEHKELVKAADALVTACASGKGRQELTGAMAFLSNYTKTHFAHEEEFMAKYKYPDLISHRNWHQAYVNSLVPVAHKLQDEGPTIALVADVNRKIGELITHIKTLDLKLAQYLKSKD